MKNQYPVKSIVMPTYKCVFMRAGVRVIVQGINVQ